jgi:hypothetical protein
MIFGANRRRESRWSTLARTCAATVATLVTASSLAVNSPIQQAYRELNVPAGKADDSLMQFVSQTGVQLLFESEAVHDRRTQAVKGRFEVKDALSRMLAGSGLLFRCLNKNTITVVPQTTAGTMLRDDLSSCSTETPTSNEIHN